MTKPQKTSQELETLILDRCRAAGMKMRSVTVSQSVVYYGWQANFFALPNLVVGYQEQFDVILNDVRSQFDLKQ